LKSFDKENGQHLFHIVDNGPRMVASSFIPRTTNLGIAIIIKGLSKTCFPIYSFTTHSDKPNLHLKKKGNKYYVIASNNIQKDKELTINKSLLK